MIVDANLLLYAVDSASPHHQPSATWPEEALNGDQRVGLPWQTIGAFLRISTNPRVYLHPLDPAAAWAFVAEWMSLEVTWIPPIGQRTVDILGRLLRDHGVSSDLVPDAQLAAIAIEHGAAVYSADTDFARFDGLRWVNPLVG